MAISDGSFGIFVESPIALTILIFAAALFFLSIVLMRRSFIKNRGMQLAVSE
jgi:TctA family transporter